MRKMTIKTINLNFASSIIPKKHWIYENFSKTTAEKFYLLLANLC